MHSKLKASAAVAAAILRSAADVAGAAMRVQWIALVLVSGFCLAGSPASAALVGFWNFDQTSGTTAYDTSGSGINGTLSPSGAAFDPGAGINGGGAINLTTGGYVDMGNNYAFSGTQSFTLQVWVDTTQTSSASLVARHYSNNQDGYILGMNNFDSFCFNSSYNNHAAIWAGDGGSTCGGITYTSPSTAVVNNHQWNQIVAVFNDGTESLYVNGALQSSASGVNIDSCSNVDFIVGGANNGVDNGCAVGTPTGSFIGLITDAAVWNTALTATQVQTAYQHPNDPSGVPAPEPVSLALLGVGLGGLIAARRAGRPPLGKRGA